MLTSKIRLSRGSEFFLRLVWILCYESPKSSRNQWKMWSLFICVMRDLASLPWIKEIDYVGDFYRREVDLKSQKHHTLLLYNRENNKGDLILFKTEIYIDSISPALLRRMVLEQRIYCF